METLDSREPKEMSGEKGALDCWDFQVNPLFLEEIISPCLNGISYEEWMSLDTNDSGSEVVVLLSDMCDEVISTNSNLILEIVEPLIFTSGHDLSCGDDVTVQGGCSNFKVMEENIEACFGKSLNQYFVEVLDIAEGSCDTLDELVRLFSAEVTKKVNSSLAQVTESTVSLNTCDSLRAASTLQMVDTTGKLFKDVLEGFKIMDESCDELACPPCNSQERWCFDSEDAENVEEDSTEISGFSFSFSEMPEVDNFDPEPVPQHFFDSESNDDMHHNEIDPFSSDDINPNEIDPVSSDDINPNEIDPVSLEPPPPDYNKIFLTVTLAKLVDHIASETGTSLENVNLNYIVNCVTLFTTHLLDFHPLTTVDNLHISIYKSLCQKVRCKYALQAAMVADDDRFVHAVSVTLISQLEKYKTSNNLRDSESETPETGREESSEQTTPSPPKRSLCSTLRKKFSRWASNVVNFFKRSGEESSKKGSPVIESQTPEPHREESSEQTTPSPPKRSLCSTLRKKFSRWASNVVNFFKRSGQ